MFQGIAKTTRKTYESAQRKFLEFCHWSQCLNANGSPLPASEWTLMLFTTHLSQTIKASSIKCTWQMYDRSTLKMALLIHYRTVYGLTSHTRDQITLHIAKHLAMLINCTYKHLITLSKPYLHALFAMIIVIIIYSWQKDKMWCSFYFILFFFVGCLHALLP